MNTTIVTELRALNTSGATLKKMKGFLMMEEVKDKDVNAYLDAAGVERKAKPRGFAAEFYAWLADAIRTMDEVEVYVMDPSNSKNTHNHLSHYKAIAQCVLDTRANISADASAAKAKKAKKAA